MRCHRRWGPGLITLLLPALLQAQTGDRPATPGIGQFEEQLKQTLKYLAETQHAYRRHHPTYAPATIYLDNPPIWPTLYVLEATESGWSAMALHERAPGLRCYIREGSARSLVAADREREPTCLVAPLPVLSPQRGPLASTYDVGELNTPPRKRACSEVASQVMRGRLNRDRSSGFDGTATFSFVIGVDGEVEPGNLTIEETTNMLAALDALVIIVNCGFDPGVVGGQPVRVMVRQQINFASH